LSDFLPTTKNLIFDSPSNLILLRTIAVPTLANNLNVANGEFDQVVLTMRNRWVSVSGIIEFQNRNRVMSIVESDRVNICLFGGSISYQYLETSSSGEKFFVFDIASYESEKLKFQQIYRGGHHKERWNKGALQSSCNPRRQLIHSYLKTAGSSKSSRKKMSDPGARRRHVNFFAA
jgi:hypothetical protein